MPLFYYLLTLTAAITNTQSIPLASTDQGRALRSTNLFFNHFTSQMRISIVSKCAAFLVKKTNNQKQKDNFIIRNNQMTLSLCRPLVLSLFVAIRASGCLCLLYSISQNANILCIIVD